MIEVRDLVRRYGPTEAVSHVSFRVNKGDIVGFLGPNGAGKTTTLRMITGFLPPTSGEVAVQGHPASEDSKTVRKLIGYLPENNPLYDDMRVTEYLAFRAELKGVPRSERKARLQDVLEVCDIGEVSHRIIGTCSKGFRQRVGLADALLAKPPVLILDEPTVGLDPVQIVHTRNLIKQLSEEHTVVLSTHILPEVEAICSRTLILHHGRLLFDGTVEELEHGLSGGGQVMVTVMAAPEAAETRLRELPGAAAVARVEDQEGHARFRITPAEGQDIREAVFRTCAAGDMPILEMASRHVSLEEAFLSITTSESEEVAV
jgi:ABC-2 type transport system ATP-binding protein